MPIDIVLLSYVVYRNAIIRINEATTKYLVATLIPWLAVLWLSISPNPRIFKSILQPQQNMPITIMFTIWIIVTIIEPLLHMKALRKKTE